MAQRKIMAILSTGGTSEERFSIPWDVSEWVEKNVLLEWVLEEIATLDWSTTELEKFLRDNPNYHPRPLVTLLTYAYATGLFESEEISKLCHRDPFLLGICGSYRPSPRVLDRFRRDNRGLLKWALVQLLKRAFRARYKLQLLPPGLRRHLEESVIERLDLARHMDRAGEGA